jgi:hypothetical protein
MNPPFSDDGKVMLNIEYQVSRVVARCLCKIGFNYVALTCGETFALSSEFNAMREFIRNDIGEDTLRVFVKGKPIIAQEIVTGQRGRQLKGVHRTRPSKYNSPYSTAFRTRFR